MTRVELQAVLPLLVLAASVLVTVLAVTVRRAHGLIAGLALAGLVAFAAAVPAAVSVAPCSIGPLLVVDRFALLYMGLVALSSAVVVAMAFPYLSRRHTHPEELYILVLLAALGAGVLVCSRHFVSLFLGLETLSVSLYGLLAYSRRRKAVEAGLKYLVLAAASSAFMLLGGALGYNATGSLDLAAIGTAASDLVASGGASPLWLTAGAVLVLVGIGFKLAVVPFHMWTPDVYEGAPAPAAALVASLSKGAVLALAVRLALLLGLHDHPAVVSLVMVVALASMTVGNLLALLQPNLKRLLAYSSIAHMGYALVALLVAGRAGAEAVSFYLVTYLVSILAAFAVIAARSGSDGSNDIVESNHIDDVDQLEAYRGLLWRRPWLAATLAVAMVSLAGLPLTAGFMGKVVVVAAGAGAGLWMPLLVLVLNSVLGLYYYLRVVVVMAAPADEQSPARRTAEARLGLPELTCTALLVILIVGVGLFPGGLMQVVARASGAVAPGPAAPGTAAVVRPVQIEAAQGG